MKKSHSDAVETCLNTKVVDLIPTNLILDKYINFNSLVFLYACGVCSHN